MAMPAALMIVATGGRFDPRGMEIGGLTSGWGAAEWMI
jgi:hypothetical protein